MSTQRPGFAAARCPDDSFAKDDHFDLKAARDLRAQRGRQQPVLGRATLEAQRLQRPPTTPRPAHARLPYSANPPQPINHTASPGANASRPENCRPFRFTRPRHEPTSPADSFRLSRRAPSCHYRPGGSKPRRRRHHREQCSPFGLQRNRRRHAAPRRA